jgi:hypothetical protein
VLLFSHSDWVRTICCAAAWSAYTIAFNSQSSAICRQRLDN